MVQHDGVEVAQQDDTAADIVVVQYDGVEHNGTLSVPPEHTLDFVCQLPTSSGSMPHLINFSTRSNA